MGRGELRKVESVLTLAVERKTQSTSGGKLCERGTHAAPVALERSVRTRYTVNLNKPRRIDARVDSGKKSGLRLRRPALGRVNLFWCGRVLLGGLRLAR